MRSRADNSGEARILLLQIANWLDDVLDRNQIVHDIDRARAREFILSAQRLPPVAGRFVFLYGEGDDFGYVTSWDTWEQAGSAWAVGNGRIPAGYKLVDDETGRTWLPGARYEWEDART